MADAPVTPGPAPAAPAAPGAAPPAAPQGQLVWDSLYARPGHATPEQLQAAPDRFAPIADQRTRMVGPNGKTWTLPASSVLEALGKGYQFLPDTENRHEARIQFYQRKHDGAFTTGLREATNQLLAGVPDVVASHELEPDELEGIARANRENRTAQVVGGIVGGGALIAATGGLGELAAGGRGALEGAEAVSAIRAARGASTAVRAAETARAVEATTAASRGILAPVEAGVTAAGAADGARAATIALDAAAPTLRGRMAAAALAGAKEGALYSSPQALAQASYGDVDHAAESLLWGVGVGGLLGLGAGAFSHAADTGRAALRGAAIEHGVIDEAGTVNRARLGIATPEQATAARQSATAALTEHLGTLDAEIARAPAKVREGVSLSGPALAAEVESKAIERAAGLGLRGALPEGKAVLRATTTALASAEPLTFSKLAEIRAASIDGAIGNTERMTVARTVDSILETAQHRAAATALGRLKLGDSFAPYLAGLERLETAHHAAVSLAAPSALAQSIAGGATRALSSAVAAKVAGPVGAAVAGPVGGFVAYKIAKPLVERVLTHALTPKSLALTEGVLSRIARHLDTLNYFGAALAKDAADASGRTIGSFARTLTTRAAAAVPPRDALKAVLGPQQANGLSKAQQYDKVAAAIDHRASNPDALADEIHAVASVFGHDPRLQAALAARQATAIHYLAGALPRGPDAPAPFAAPWQPTREQKRAFSEKLEVVHDPWSAVAHASAGTLTKNHVDALRSVYPSHYAAIQESGLKMAFDPAHRDMPARQKQALSLLTGMQLSPTIIYQNAYRGDQPTAAGFHGAPHRGHRGGAGHPEAPSFTTPVQTRETR